MESSVNIKMSTKTRVFNRPCVLTMLKLLQSLTIVIICSDGSSSFCAAASVVSDANSSALLDTDRLGGGAPLTNASMCDKTFSD